MIYLLVKTYLLNSSTFFFHVDCVAEYYSLRVNAQASFKRKYWKKESASGSCTEPMRDISS